MNRQPWFAGVACTHFELLCRFLYWELGERLPELCLSIYYCCSVSHSGGEMKLFIGKQRVGGEGETGGGGIKNISSERWHIVTGWIQAGNCFPMQRDTHRHTNTDNSLFQIFHSCQGKLFIRFISILVHNKNHCASFCAVCISIGANAAHEMKNVVSAFAAKY